MPARLKKRLFNILETKLTEKWQVEYKDLFSELLRETAASPVSSEYRPLLGRVNLASDISSLSLGFPLYKMQADAEDLLSTILHEDVLS